MSTTPWHWLVVFREVLGTLISVSFRALVLFHCRRVEGLRFFFVFALVQLSLDDCANIFVAPEYPTCSLLDSVHPIDFCLCLAHIDPMLAYNSALPTSSSPSAHSCSLSSPPLYLGLSR